MGTPSWRTRPRPPRVPRRRPPRATARAATTTPSTWIQRTERRTAETTDELQRAVVVSEVIRACTACVSPRHAMILPMKSIRNLFYVQTTLTRIYTFFTLYLIPGHVL